MSDIVERLRGLYALEQRDSAPGFSDPSAPDDAAAEIERLRLMLAELQQAYDEARGPQQQVTSARVYLMARVTDENPHGLRVIKEEP